MVRLCMEHPANLGETLHIQSELAMHSPDVPTKLKALLIIAAAVRKKLVAADVTSAVKEKYVSVFGEKYRRLIEDALDWLNEKEPTWNVSFDHDAFIHDLVNRY